MPAFVPSYLRLHQSGELTRRAQLLREKLSSCTLCPHNCGNNRLNNDIARCYSGLLPIVSSSTVHYGEEPLLVGTNGVGNIFFGNCNLRCVYCQNHEISQDRRRERANEVSIERLAAIMLELQERDVHAIGFVSPTHFAAQIAEAVDLAVAKGLRLPLIYNTNAYDAPEVLRLFEGIVDIYLPDLKYADDHDGYIYSKVRNYPAVAREAIREMHRQVGSTLVIGDDGLVKRGLIIRHLVLPNDLAGSRESLTWIHDELGRETVLSVMAQYYPAHKAASMPLLDRKIRESEYERVLRILDRLGMDCGWVQDFEATEYYRPEFANRDAPFKGGVANEDVQALHTPAVTQTTTGSTSHAKQ